MIEIKLQNNVVLFQRGGDGIIVPFTASPEVHAAAYKLTLKPDDENWCELLIVALADMPVAVVKIAPVGEGPA